MSPFCDGTPAASQWPIPPYHFFDYEFELFPGDAGQAEHVRRFLCADVYLTTHALAEVLRGWLSWHPEKVLFGTDAYSDENTPLSDYEEKQWLLTKRSRDAVAIALTVMMSDGEISRSRAVAIAKMVFRDNAMRLYGLQSDSLP